MMRINKKIRATLIPMLLIAFGTAAFRGNSSGSHARYSRTCSRGWGSRAHGEWAQGRRAFDTTDAVFEMMRLQSYYAGMDHVSFDVSYNQVTWISGMATARIDTCHYKVNGNKYYMKSLTAEQLQDSNYNLVVYPGLEQLILSRPNYFFQAVFQMDLMDPDFQIANVQNMTVRDTSNMRMLSFQFYTESMFKNLNILYDTAGYRLRTIQGTMDLKGALPGDTVTTAPRTTITLTFSNYQNGMFTDTVFNMNRFFTRPLDSFLFVPPYDTYQFVNSTLD